MTWSDRDEARRQCDRAIGNLDKALAHMGWLRSHYGDRGHPNARAVEDISVDILWLQERIQTFKRERV